MGWPKEPTPEQRKKALDRLYVLRMKEVCECGLTFAVHGAAFPHDRGDECKAFKRATATGKDA